MRSRSSNRDARRLEHLLDTLVRHDGCSIGVEHDDVSLADRGAAHHHGLADRAWHLLLGAGARRTQRAQTGRPKLAQLLDVAHGRVDEERCDAAPLGLRREQLADESDRGRLRHGEDEHLPGLRLGDRGVHHQGMSP